MLRRLRLPFLFSSLAFLAYAIYAFVIALRANPELRQDLSDRFNTFDHAAEQRRARERQQDIAYAKRLRDDAYARIQLADYDNASERLDEAALYDPDGDRSARDVHDARQAIADNRMPPSGAHPTGSTGPDKRSLTP
jgi:hypothetical protein